MTPGRRRALAIGVGAAAGLAGVAVAVRQRLSAADAQHAEALWSMQFDLPAGNKLVMANLRGKPLIINFWATWCAPCVRELPALQRFQREHAAQGWRVIALAVDQPVPVLAFMHKLQLELTVAMAGIDGLEWQRLMGNSSGGLPFTVVLDAQGRVLERRLGETHYNDLVRWAAAAR